MRVQYSDLHTETGKEECPVMRLSKRSERKWHQVALFSLLAALFAAPWFLGVLRIPSPIALPTALSPLEWWDPLLLGFSVLCECVWLVEVAWQLVGRETIRISDGGIVVRHEILRASLSTRCAAERIVTLEVSPLSNEWFADSRSPSFWTFKYGVVAVKCGRRTIRFGAGMPTDGANSLVKEIRDRFPMYGPQR
jgi:hypothetical protein